jgi:hypothetical protein
MAMRIKFAAKIINQFRFHWQTARSKLKKTSIATVPDVCLATVKILTTLFLFSNYLLTIIWLTNFDLYRYDDPVPRPHEDGGKYGKGVIGREAEDILKYTTIISMKEKSGRGRDKRFCRR